MADFYETKLIFASGQQGWSELYYQFASFPNTALTAATALANERCKLLGKYAWMTEVRISAFNELRDSLSRSMVATGTSSLLADRGSLAILCRCEASSLYRRSVWLRGIPDDWAAIGAAGTAYAGSFYPFFTSATNAIAKMAKILIDNPWFVKAHGKSGSGNFPGNRITGFVTSGAPRVNTVLILESTTDAFPGEKILIRKTVGPDKRKFGRTWNVIATPTSSRIEIDLPYADALAMDLDVLGVVLTRHLTFERITALRPLRLAAHQTGGPVGGPKGKVKRRECES